MEDVDKYTKKDATHYLSCRHSLGRNGYDYNMDCLILKHVPGGQRVKILVFGDRNWKNMGHIKKIRYVPCHRVREKNGND